MSECVILTAHAHPLCLQFEDNLLDVAPPIVFFISLVAFVKWKRVQMLKEHRD